MATNTPSPTPAPPPGGNSQPSNKTPYIVAIVLLSLAVIVLGIVSFSQGKAKGELTEELTETQELKDQLETQYYEAMTELEELQGSNEQLNALIETQKEELTAQKDRIDRLLRDSRNLSQARKEIQGLKAQVEQYMAEINQLREENQELMAENSQLAITKDSLATNLELASMRNEELSTARAALVSEKEMLEEDRAMLAEKVSIASVVKVENVEANGLKLRNSGKAVKRRNASNVDQLQVCFTTTVNQVVEPGTEEFVVRIIDPLGETLAIDQLGSGIFTSNATGEQIRYTKIKEYDYNRDENTLCLTWQPNIEFLEGDYEVEIYNKGFLAGRGSFSLR